MRCHPIQQPLIGSTIERWLWLRDINFPDSGHQYSFPEVPLGLVTTAGWVIFHRRQLFLAVPDEVHTFWHHEQNQDLVRSFAFQVEESLWLASFDQRHLSLCHHFVLDFRDDIVEVICEKLLFGAGPFELEAAITLHPELGDAYYWRAMAREKAGDLRFADDLRKVASADGAYFQSTAKALLKSWQMNHESCSSPLDLPSDED